MLLQTTFMLYYHCVRDRIMISNLQHGRKIAVLDVDGFQTCFVSVASAFENIELGYIHCALKENFNVTSPLSLFRFHLSPFPQKRLILRL